MAKVYCDALPENYGLPETLGLACLKVLAQAFYYLATKEVWWRRQPAVRYGLETISWDYFDAHQRLFFDGLPGPNRLSPRTPDDFQGRDAAGPVARSVTPRTLAALLLAPLTLPGLWILSRKYELNLITAFRKALSVYAVFEGHFRRYPCRHFVTYEDMHNHPSRYLAFRQNCSGSLAVIQNGDRTYHPSYAFGMMDLYLSHGSFASDLFRDLRCAAKVVPAGSISLNRWHGLIEATVQSGEPIRYDILVIDQSCWPYNMYDLKTARSLDRLYANVNELKRRRPRYRIAYQMRNYADTPAVRADLLRWLRGIFTEPIEILENTGRGESYSNIVRSRLVMAFDSSLGNEAWFVGPGRKVLFVNYAGNPFEVCCEDPRFQLYDETGDPRAFEEAVERLLALDLPEPPTPARRRHAFFDGRVEERISQVLKELG
ncbi:MAG: hypothetical protein HY748_08850 [Elusimicrobia bacterium]|nr:hypothetical protein [Elusimicrobiota bacterium]